MALQYAKIAGATVVAVDLVDEKLELAKKLGADYTVNGKAEDPVEAIQKLGGANAVISLAVSPRAFEQAFRALRRGGTLVFVALPADNYMQRRSSKPCSMASRSWAQLWELACTWRKSSNCTQMVVRK